MKKLILSFLILITSLNNFAQKRKPLDSKTKTQVIKALDLNDELHMAFFEYDAKVVMKQAVALKKALTKLKGKELEKLFAPAIKELGQISSESKRAENNEHYAKASLSLVYLVNHYDVGPGYNAYMCPMVKKKWVQNSKKRDRTHNPYAPEMPHCGGRVTDY